MTIFTFMYFEMKIIVGCFRSAKSELDFRDEEKCFFFISQYIRQNGLFEIERKRNSPPGVCRSDHFKSLLLFLSVHRFLTIDAIIYTSRKKRYFSNSRYIKHSYGIIRR